jgi:F-box domain
MTSAMILDLPPKVLDHVLSWCLLYEDFSNVVAGVPEFWTTLLSLRGVCRALRHRVDRLPFWQKENFDFADFKFLALHYPKKHELPGSTFFDQDPDKMRFLVDTVLQDTHLCQQLGKKSDWTVSLEGSSDLLWIIVSNLPDFGQRARKINLKMKGRFPRDASIINTSVSVLESTFPNLECLRLHVNSDHSWTQYSREHTQLLDPRVYTLHEFSALKELVISVKSCPPWNLADLLPIKSTSTLTKFSYNGNFTHNSKFDPLKAFINLKHLKLSGISWQFCRYLALCPFRLETFEAWATCGHFNLHRRPLAELWISEPFRNLKHLSFGAYFGTPKASIYGAVIEGITQLSNLETLDLTMPLEWAWCPQFNSLGKLKKLKWTTERKHMLVNGKIPRRQKPNWKHKFKERFRAYLPTFCHLDFSITITYSYQDAESDYWNYSDVYSAFTDSDSDAEWARDINRPEPRSMGHNEWHCSAWKRKKYGHNYSTNSRNFSDIERARNELKDPDSSSGFESCEDGPTYDALRQKRRKRPKAGNPIKSALYSGDESDSENGKSGKKSVT